MIGLDTERWESCILCTILFIHGILYIPLVETYLLYIVFIFVLLIYYIDENITITFNRPNTCEEKVRDICEDIYTPDKNDTVITTKCRIISAST